MSLVGNCRIAKWFNGNWDLFKTAVQNPQTAWVYDIDGILLNSTEVVSKDFTRKTELKTAAKEIDAWEYLLGRRQCFRFFI